MFGQRGLGLEQLPLCIGAWVGHVIDRHAPAAARQHRVFRRSGDLAEAGKAFAAVGDPEQMPADTMVLKELRVGAKVIAHDRRYPSRSRGSTPTRPTQISASPRRSSYPRKRSTAPLLFTSGSGHLCRQSAQCFKPGHRFRFQWPPCSGDEQPARRPALPGLAPPRRRRWSRCGGRPPSEPEGARSPQRLPRQPR